MEPEKEGKSVFNFSEHPIIEIPILLISFVILVVFSFGLASAYPFSWDYFFGEDYRGMSEVVIIIFSSLVLLTGFNSIFKRTWKWE